jgi:hypothetical protein
VQWKVFSLNVGLGLLVCESKITGETIGSLFNSFAMVLLEKLNTKNTRYGTRQPGVNNYLSLPPNNKQWQVQKLRLIAMVH